MGGGDVRNIMYYGINGDVRDMIKDATAFLHEIKVLPMAELDKDLIDSSWTDEILKKANLKVPLARIEAQDPSKYPGGKINLPASWRKD
jgi:hypothetical protein